MSKNKRRNRETPAEAEAVASPAVETPADNTNIDLAAIEQHIAETPEVTAGLETPAEPAAETTPEQVATAVAESVTEPAKPVIRYEVLADRREFKFRRGFETVLNHELVTNGGGTVEELTQRLLDSGEYQRVAPAAAANRATKPVAFLLRQWTTGRLLSATEVIPEAPSTEGAPADSESSPADAIPAAEEGLAVTAAE